MSIYRGRTKNEVYLSSQLYDAIEDQDLRSVKILLSIKGADPNLILPKKRISPFHLIIGNESESFALEVTRLILLHGGNPNVQADDGLTPIHIAAAWGRYDILKLLLDSGGNPEYRDINGNTPLHYALEENYPNCFELLKIYLPDNLNFFNRNKEDCLSYDLNLDKILVNNGTTVGEYEIINEYKTDSIYKKHLEKLQELPQSDSKEYVMTWFQSLQTDTNDTKVVTTPENSSEFSGESEESNKETDNEVSKIRNMENISFRKVYRKKVKSPKNKSPPKSRTIQSALNDDSLIKQLEILELSNNFSNESGIVTLADTNNSLQDSANSHYVTCDSKAPPNYLDMNIFNLTDSSLITNDETDKSIKSQISTITKSEGISSTDLSFVTVSEIYKYVDEEEGITLYERRFLKTSVSDINGSVRSFQSSQLSSLPETLDYEDYDPDIIRRELVLLGYNPGPITVTTKRVYLKKLKQLKKHPLLLNVDGGSRKVYSLELEKTLKNSDWLKDVMRYKVLDETVVRQFATPDPKKNWREGVSKSSFTYLLLDPRITNNLPARADSMKPNEIWETFLSAVFYVGKGKRSRPYSHLYDAVSLWKQDKRKSVSKKLDRILDIWKDNCGVVCLHVFQNTIPVEAYTREAAIIDALKIDNLCNAISGNFYGIAATWSQKEKSMYGVFLLHKAMTIFLHEGERQLCPSDID